MRDKLCRTVRVRVRVRVGVRVKVRIRVASSNGSVIKATVWDCKDTYVVARKLLQG